MTPGVIESRLQHRPERGPPASFGGGRLLVRAASGADTSVRILTMLKIRTPLRRAPLTAPTVPGDTVNQSSQGAARPPLPPLPDAYERVLATASALSQLPTSLKA